MIRALLTWPWRSKRLRTASSEALKSRLPTNMFFTLVSCPFESGGSSVEVTQAGKLTVTLGRISRKLVKRDSNIARAGKAGQTKSAEKQRKSKLRKTTKKKREKNRKRKKTKHRLTVASFFSLPPPPPLPPARWPVPGGGGEKIN